MKQIIIDLTLPIDQRKLADWLKKQENPYAVQGHIGTHLDIYNRSQIPLEYFQSKGIYIDVSHIKDEITIQDLQHIQILERSFVLFRTGIIEKYDYGTRDYFKKQPQFSQETIDMLIEKKVCFIGIDCAGLKSGKDHEMVDRKCEENGIYVIENLWQLDRLQRYANLNMYTFWLDDGESTGLRCRVLGVVEENYVST